VRHALVYVLANFRKHDRAARGAIDPCSSAPWFDGWCDLRDRDTRARADPPVRAPRTWLASVGWRRRGLLSTREAPASA
jgi:hypothetical protein